MYLKRLKPALFFSIVLATFLVFSLTTSHVSAASSFTVNTTSDSSDANIGDGLCDVDLGTPLDQCTLRAAIENANAVAGPTTIDFNIPISDAGYVTGGPFNYWSIKPASNYPIIVKQVTIQGAKDGSGNLLIELNGSLDVAIPNYGLQFGAGSEGSLVDGLVINEFDNDNPSAAIVINNVNSAPGSPLTIRSSLIGVNNAGDTEKRNIYGIMVQSSDNVVIGKDITDTSSTPYGNVISSSIEPNLLVDCGVSGMKRVVVAGNKIGLNKAGTDGFIPVQNMRPLMRVTNQCNIQIGDKATGVDETLHRNYFGAKNGNYDFPLSTYALSLNPAGNDNVSIKIYNNFFSSDASGNPTLRMAEDIQMYGDAFVGGVNSIDIGASGKGNLFYGDYGLDIETDRNLNIVSNTIASRYGGLWFYETDHTNVLNNHITLYTTADKNFGKSFDLRSGGTQVTNIGAKTVYKGNLVEWGGIGFQVNPVATFYNRNLADDKESLPIIGGSGMQTGSLCKDGLGNGLEANCIENNSYDPTSIETMESGILFIDSKAQNYTTIYTDNKWNGGNGFNHKVNIKSTWESLFELFTGAAKRTDFAPGTVTLTFPNNSFYKTKVIGNNPWNEGVIASAKNQNVPGLTGNGAFFGGAATININQSWSWLYVVDYEYDENGLKHDYSLYKFDDLHFVSQEFSFDGNSLTQPQVLPDRGEVWTDYPLSNGLPPGPYGRHQIMEVDLVDANPVWTGSEYVITVDSTTDEDNVSLTGYNDGTGAYSGGGMTGVNGMSNNKTSLREAIIVANKHAGHEKIVFNIPTTDPGYINPDGSRTSTSEPAGTYTVTPGGYFIINNADPSLVISNNQDGVTIDGYSQPGAQRNTASFGQSLNTQLKIQITRGIYILSSSNNHITGLDIRRLSSGSHTIDNPSNVATENNWFEGNFWGVNILGTLPETSFGSGSFSIRTSGTTGVRNTIFGTNGDGTGDKGERNLISGMATQTNIGDVINAGAQQTIIAGNYIGTDYTGNVCIRPNSGDDRTSVELTSLNSRIGSNLDGISDDEEGNIMGCVNSNIRGFIRLLGPGTADNIMIAKNYIGISPSGANLTPNNAEVGITTLNGPGLSHVTIKQNIIANVSSGIALNTNYVNAVIDSNKIYNILGGAGFTTSANGAQVKNNEIYNSTGTGATIISGTGNTIENNIIKNITGLPIDLLPTGMNINDAGDLDTGANDLMNSPTISKVEYIGGGNYKVYGDIDVQAAEKPIHIEVCEADNNASGSGGCLQTLGTGTANSPWVVTINISGDDGTQSHKLTVLGTNSTGSTSEFGANFTIPGPSYTVTQYPITLVSPIGGITIDDPLPYLDWSPSLDPDLKEYKVFLDGNYLATVSKSQTAYQYNGSPLSGQHSWKVEGIRNNNTTGGTSTTESFIVSVATQLEIISPKDNVVIDSQTPLLDFNGGENATYFEIYVNGKFFKKVTQSEYQVLANEPLSEGNYEWYIIAYFTAKDANGADVTSEIGRTTTEKFIIRKSYTLQILNIQSSHEAQNYSKLTITWMRGGSDPGKSTYTLQIIDSKGNYVLEKKGLPLSQTVYTLTADELKKLEVNANYIAKVILESPDNQTLAEDTKQFNEVATLQTSAPLEAPNILLYVCLITVIFLFLVFMFLFLRRRRQQEQ